MSSKEDETDAGGSQKIIKRADKFNTLHLVAFIMCCVAGRQYSDWQPALTQGFAQFMVAQIIIAAVFIVSFLCLAEIWSAVPFSGGGYGLARAVIGFYPGFLMGCADAFVFITHSAVSALFLAISIVEVAKLPDDATIGIVIAVYLAAVALAIQPSTVILRRSFVVLAILSIGILVFWLLGSLKYTNFAENASLHRSQRVSAVSNWFTGGMDGFMHWLPYASLPYAGLRSFTLMTGFAEQPKVTLPRAVLISIAFIFCLNMFVVFVNASLPNNWLLDNPMLVGWRDMFKLTLDATHHFADLIAFPAAFAKVYAYVLPCGALFQSLGRTNLLPSAMGLYRNRDHTRGVLWTSFLGFIMCLWIHFQPHIDLYDLCILFTVLANLALMYCYIKLKFFCPNLERGFVSPLGIPGAVFVMVMMLMLFVSAAFFQKNHFPLMAIGGTWFVLTVYYYGCAEKGQTLCKEEDKVFLLLHVKNFNRNKRKHTNRIKGNKVQAAVQAKSPSEGSTNAAVGARKESSSSFTDLASAGLWAQFRHMMFKNNMVSPSRGSSSHGSSHGSSRASLCDAQPASARPDAATTTVCLASPSSPAEVTSALADEVAEACETGRSVRAPQPDNCGNDDEGEEKSEVDVVESIRGAELV